MLKFLIAVNEKTMGSLAMCYVPWKAILDVENIFHECKIAPTRGMVDA